MKLFKKILFIVLIVIGFGLIIGGGIYLFIKTNNRSINDVMDILYEKVPEDKRAMYYTINEDNFYDFLGNAKFKYDSAIASTPLADDVIHQVVLIDVKKDADVSKIMQDIADNINLDKYNNRINGKDIIIKSNGDFIIYIVIEDKSVRNTISDAFDRL